MTFVRTELAEALLESMAIVVCDLATGTISDATEGAEELFGYRVRGALIGMNVDELVPQDRRDAHLEKRFDYELAPHRKVMNVTACRKDGVVFPVKVTLIPKVMGGAKSVIAVVLDLSDVRE